MFYEDVDLGWRLNLLGHHVRHEPASVAFHRNHASMRSYGEFREAYLFERNALLSMYENFGDDALSRVLLAAMALSVRRSVARADLDARMLDPQTRPGGDDQGTVEVPKNALTGPLAIAYLVENFPSLHLDLQARRRRTDPDRFPVFRKAIEPVYPFPSDLEAHRWLVEAFGIEDPFARRRRIAVVTGEPLGSEFSFRTPILDHLWAGLPAVCRDGDAFGDLVSERELGIAVPPEDADALAAAPRRVLTDEVFASSCAERSAAVARQFTWAAALRPLVVYCRSPKRAADPVERVGEATLGRQASYRAPRRTDLRAGWALARTNLREVGLSEVARGARGRLRRGGI